MYKASYKFVKRDTEGRTVILKIDDGYSHSQLCEAFTEFLLGCGFKFEGTVQIVQDPMEEVYDMMLESIDEVTTSGAV